MNSVLLIALIIISLIIILLYIVEPNFFNVKLENANEYGSSRFATFQEIKKNFNKEKVSDINESGFPIWYSKDNKYVWFDRETPHYVYLGSTGSGKSVTAVIPTCSFIANAKVKRSVFVTDPKGEIYSKTSKMFKDNGYNIYTIDFRNPELSNKINLLEPIINEYEMYIKYDNEANKLENDINYYESRIESLKEDIALLKNTPHDYKDKEEELLKVQNDLKTSETKLVEFRNKSMKHFAETNRLITSISSMIVTDKGKEKDPFWNNSAKNLLEGLIGLFLEEYKKGKITREKLTLTSIKKFQNSSMDEENFELLKKYIDSKPYGLKSKDSLTSIFSAAENTYKSITATFGEKLALFDDVNVANITSSSDFEFDILGKEPTVIYIIVPDEDKTYYSLITIIVGLLYRELVKLANSNENKKLPIQIDWLLDEFANCPPLSDIEAIVSVARSRGMRFQFFIQSFSQLDNVYGKEVAQIILDNCGLAYLKTNTQESAELISKFLGKKTIKSNSVSQSIGKLDSSGNMSTSLMGRELLTPEEVKQLHHKTIIFPIIGYPIFRDTVVYNSFCCYKSGEEKREVRTLKDLSNTYYTVEKLERNLKKQKTKQLETSEDEINELYEALKKTFEIKLKQVSEILASQKFDVDYPKDNNVMYCKVVVYNLINGNLENSIIDLCDERFHIEVKYVDNYTMINIHKIL